MKEQADPEKRIYEERTPIHGKLFKQGIYMFHS